MFLTNLDADDRHSYTRVHYPSELTLEEKNDLLFALLEHLKLKVMRADFDESFTILVPE